MSSDQLELNLRNARLDKIGRLISLAVISFVGFKTYNAWFGSPGSGSEAAARAVVDEKDEAWAHLMSADAEQKGVPLHYVTRRSLGTIEATLYVNELAFASLNVQERASYAVAVAILAGGPRRDDVRVRFVSDRTGRDLASGSPAMGTFSYEGS